MRSALTYGAFRELTPKQLSLKKGEWMPSVLFVCTANRFRSPLAAHIMNKLLSDRKGDDLVARLASDLDQWQVSSAGTWANNGEPVLPVVNEAAQKLDIDLSDHRSRRLDGQLLAEYDLILVMQNSHKESLQLEYPLRREHVYLLSHVVERGSYDIIDALGSEQEVKAVVREIYTLIQRGLPYICVLATALHNQHIRMK